MRIITTDTQSGLRLPSFITVGMFDGVHLGHRALLVALREKAWTSGLESTVVTFTNHPLEVIDKTKAPKNLTTTAQKLSLIEFYGIDNCILIPFTRDIQQHDAGCFLDFINRMVNIKGLLAGFNNNFGRKGENSIEEAAIERGVNFIRFAEEMIEGDPVSSSLIRKLLENGSVEKASIMLGRPYSLDGIVGHGKEVGRTIGFPTANILPVDSNVLVPGNGVYFGRVKIEGELWYRPAMINVGMNPTVSNEKIKKVEVHIVDIPSGTDLYSKSIAVEFLAYHRPEYKFKDLESLRLQLEKDREKLKTINSIGL